MAHIKEAIADTSNIQNLPDGFIRNDQFNFIKNQAKILVNGKATSNDAEVLEVLRHLAEEKVFGLFSSLNAEQKTLLEPLKAIEEPADAEAYLSQLAPYRKPFKGIAQQGLKKLFPKAKKLKGPKLETLDFKKMSYIGWIESSTVMYLVAEKDGKLTGVHGSFTRSAKKGICSLCSRHSEVGMFTAKTKGSGQDNFIKRGNYICQDSETCNSQIETLERLHEFIDRLQK